LIVAMTKQSYCFSGRMYAGKDYVAERAGLKIVGFADPMYEIAEGLFGTRNKEVTGMRAFLQYLGQVGWGCVSEKYPLTPERATFVQMIRDKGAILTTGFRWVNWHEYGKRQDFWVNIMMTKLGFKLAPKDEEWRDDRRAEGRVSLRTEPDPDVAYGVVNARFEHEMVALKAAGFKHVHVMCSDDTRNARAVAKGKAITATDDNDLSEQLGIGLDRCFGLVAGGQQSRLPTWENGKVIPVDPNNISLPWDNERKKAIQEPAPKDVIGIWNDAAVPPYARISDMTISTEVFAAQLRHSMEPAVV
jgi:hypothetical protein